MDYCEECSKDSTKMDVNDRLNAEQHHVYLNSHRHMHNRTFRRRHLSLNSFIYSSLLLVLLTTLIPISLASFTCSHHEYWDSKLSECVPCTKCNNQQMVVRPCQRHMDAICKPIQSIEIDWSKSLATERTRKEFRHHATMDTLSAQASTSEEELLWDWQIISVILAFVACLLFFVVTAVISINYVRKWRKIKKQFDTDIEELSQQLMARLAMPPLESSTIFIDDPSTKRCPLGPRQIEVRCVYLEDILAGKESLKDPHNSRFMVSNSPAGNVYIENTEPSRHVIVGHKIV